MSRRTMLAGISALTIGGLTACAGGKKKGTSATATTFAPGTPTAPTTAVSATANPSPSTSPTPATTATTGTTIAYFPPANGEWEHADPVASGWSAKGLADLVTVVKNNKSATFMMLAGGRILVEAYFLGATTMTRLDVASVQKSVTSTLVGLARDRGLLQFDDPVSKYLAPGWSRAATVDEAKITLRQLMTHSSGLDPTTLRKRLEPGTAFEYNTEAYQKLRPVLEKVAVTDINSLSRAWLFDAISIGGSWTAREGEKDATGATIWGLHLSAREMARFGLFAQRSGLWSGKQLAKAGWFAEAWTPSAVKADYGLLWWLQGQGPLGRLGAPRDLVSALGAADQKIYVVPSLDLVVTRQGQAAGSATENESDFDAVLFKAIAAARA